METVDRSEIPGAYAQILAVIGDEDLRPAGYVRLEPDQMPQDIGVRYVCSMCRVSVHPAHRYCSSCGAEFVNGGSYGT